MGGAGSRAPRFAAALLAAALLTMAAGCRGCPPGWLDDPPEVDGWLFAAGASAEVFAEADATSVALTRAARRLGDRLGLDLERRLSVVRADERLFVEAVGPDGPLDALAELELVERVECDGRTYVLVRLPREPRARGGR